MRLGDGKRKDTVDAVRYRHSIHVLRRVEGEAECAGAKHVRRVTIAKGLIPATGSSPMWQ